MVYVSPDSFAGILAAAMEEKGVGPTRLSELLFDRDPRYKITKSKISEYMQGIHTPSYEKAKALLDTIEYDITGEKLIEALRVNRQNRKEDQPYSKSSDRELIVAARIKYGLILPKHNPQEAEAIFWERVEYLTDGKRNLSKYIQSLIAKDMKEWILSKEEVEKIDESNSNR